MERNIVNNVSIHGFVLFIWKKWDLLCATEKSNLCILLIYESKAKEILWLVWTTDPIRIILFVFNSALLRLVIIYNTSLYDKLDPCRAGETARKKISLNDYSFFLIEF